MNNTRHRRTRVPDAFETMSARADDDRRGLSACCTPVQVCKIVGHDLQRVQHIIEILNFTDGSQAAHGHPNRLPQDRRFPNARIHHAQRAVFFLHPFETLVYIAKEADILTERDHARVTP